MLYDVDVTYLDDRNNYQIDRTEPISMRCEKWFQNSVMKIAIIKRNSF